jgi:hypothetical protein
VFRNRVPLVLALLLLAGVVYVLLGPSHRGRSNGDLAALNSAGEAGGASASTPVASTGGAADPAPATAATTDCAEGASAAAGPADASSEDTSGPIPENLGLPLGPFDPVLMRSASDLRMTPPTNKVVNDPTGEPVSTVQSEVSIAVHGDTLVVGWNDGYGFLSSETLSGYGYSTDRGETWVDGGQVPNGPSNDVFGDPCVVATADGLWLFFSIDLGSPNGTSVHRSHFQGGSLTWGTPLKYTDQNQFIDKEYAEYDEATDKIYLTYTIGSGRLSSSTDGGQTWSTPLTVASGSNPNGFYPAPGVNGEVYVSWMNPLGGDNARLYVRYSSDGGQSWAGSAVQVAQLGPSSGSPPQCFNRDFNVTFPSPAVDRSNGAHRGRVYLTYCDGGPGNFDVYLKYSDDKGQTWSPAAKLNDNDNTSEQFWPQVHVGPYGRVTVCWYDRRNAQGGNSLCDFYVTQSVDGGQTWGPNRRISDTSVAWCGVPANLAPNFGDYTEMVTDDRSVYCVWSDARLGDPDVIFGRFDDRHLLAVTGTGSEGLAPLDGNGTAWFIPNEAEYTISPAPALDSQSELLIPGLAMATLATPPERDGIFKVGAQRLSGDLTLSSELGTVQGTFTIRRTDPQTIDLDFDATSAPGLSGIVFGPEWTVEATLANGSAGRVNIFGTATMNRVSDGPLAFSLSGVISLGGFLSGLPSAEALDHTARVSTGLNGLTLHTRTLVEDGLTVDVEPLALGTNPPPLATIRATPNPIESSTKIAYSLTHAANGAIRVYSSTGRVVRTVAEGPFEPGSHTVAFDGRDDSGRKLPAGGYFLKLDADVVQAAAKMFVVR